MTNNSIHFYKLVPVLTDNRVCKNNGRPLSGVYRKCQCRFGYKGYNCVQRGKDFESLTGKNIFDRENFFMPS
jgi:hypothetical protein